MEKLPKYFEIYKCVVLTLIAFFLGGIWLNTPMPFTLENFRSKRAGVEKIPLVRIQSGNVDIDNTVHVEGTVSIEK